MRPDLVLCLGNEILGDDGFGAVVAGKLAQSVHGETEIIFAPVAGFALLDLLADRSRVLIVDTIQTGAFPPGTLHHFTTASLAHSNHLINSHQISLPAAIELGRKLGVLMPSSIEILAVEAEDVHTLSEELCPAVSRAVKEAIGEIRQWISFNQKEVHHGTNGKTVKTPAHGPAQDLSRM